MKPLVNLLKVCNSKNHTNLNDSGRSMVEMLGVLAVIGVLSIAGIMGYTYAMTKYQANQIIAEINYIANDIEMQMHRGNKTVSLGDPYGSAGADDGHINTSGYPLKYNCGGAEIGTCPSGSICDPICKYEDMYYIELDDIPLNVCQSVVGTLKHLPHLDNIVINDIPEATEANCIAGDSDNNSNRIALFFKMEQSAISRPEDYCTSNNSCKNGNLCHNNTCGCQNSEECDPLKCDEASQKCICESNDECISAYGNEKPLCVQGICIPCPKNEYYDTNTHQCIDGCRENYNCEDGYYCHIVTNDQYYEHSQVISSSCKKAESEMKPIVTGTNYRISKPINNVSRGTMPVWSAKRLCNALGMEIMSISDYSCTTSSPSKGQYCKENSTNVTTYDSNDIAPIVKHIQEKYNINSKFCAWGSPNEPGQAGRILNMCIYNNGKIGAIDQSYSYYGASIICRPK